MTLGERLRDQIQNIRRKPTPIADLIPLLSEVLDVIDLHDLQAKNTKSLEKVSPEHERYVWLRDGKSVHRGWGGSAPYVMSPGRSRLYAIHCLRSDALDAEVDADILNTKADELHKSNEIVERRLMVRPDFFSDEYADVLYKLAQSELGWSDERAKNAIHFMENS